MEGWKFKILAWQETNRRWDGPIANSFRVERRSPCSLLPPPIHWTPSPPPPPPPLSATSVVFSLLFFFVSLFSSFDLLFFHSYTPTDWSVGWCCVGIQRPHNRPPRSFCLVERHLGLRLLPRHLHLLLFFHLFLIQPGQPCPLLLFLLFFFFFLPSWSPIDKGMRPSPFSTQEKREAKRQGSVREEARRW